MTFHVNPSENSHEISNHIFAGGGIRTHFKMSSAAI